MLFFSLLTIPPSLSVLTGHTDLTYKTNTLGFLVNSFKYLVLVLLFYVHGKHLRSCWDSQLT